MVVSAAFQQTIRDLMRDTCWDVDADTRKLANVAGALPIGFDLCNNMFIRLDGAVGGAAYDAEHIGFREPSPAALISAMLFGAKRIPQLASLIPSRPDDACECSQCKGSGKLPMSQHTNCNLCGGVGWIADRYVF